MDRNLIAIDEGLDNLEAILKEEGFEVVGLSDPRWQEAAAVVVSGLKENLLGMQDTLTKAPVIRASGRQPEEIIYDIRKHINFAFDTQENFS